MIYQSYSTLIDIDRQLKQKTLISQGDDDVYIPGLVARNRALPDDIVAVKIQNKRLWRVHDNYVNEDSSKVSENVQKIYVTLEKFIAQSPNGLHALLGPKLAIQIINDLDSPNDPKPDAESDGEQHNYHDWWSVIQRTGYVVGILHELHSRTMVGYLNVPNSKRKNNQSISNDSHSDSMTETDTTATVQNTWKFAFMTPIDTRLPKVIIPFAECSEDFQKHPEAHSHVRFVCHIVSWPNHSLLPKGKLLRFLSDDNADLAATETDRILINAGFDGGLDAANEFPPDCNDYLNELLDRILHPDYMNHELKFRKDFRNLPIFTIDPSSARDLDDAIHVRDLTSKEISCFEMLGVKDAFYEVGVHIADVSYFVRPNTVLDREAAKRATSIYLVQLCVPMLPRALCEEQCSLNPGQDKLAFSVVFIVNKQGKILKTWFGRTVIRSCCKLSYDDAQKMIDNPDCPSSLHSIVQVHGPHTLEVVHQSVVKMNELSIQMRERRFNSGSLRLNTIKPVFNLDKQHGVPLGVSPQIPKSSCSLIEEWMLAANESVAKLIAHHLPNLAFLRRHPPPTVKQLTEVTKVLKNTGVDVDTDSAGSIQTSLSRITGLPMEIGYRHSNELGSLCFEYTKLSLQPSSESKLDDDVSKLKNSKLSHVLLELEREAKLSVIVSLLTKTMNLAVYFCNELLPEHLSTHHYALNKEFYTHFTSPIRRYADVIVHRQLAWVIANNRKLVTNEATRRWYLETSPPVSGIRLQRIAEVCNCKKINARMASEESDLLFYTLFVKDNGPLVESCSVISVLNKSFDVLILSSGLVRRVYCQNLNLKTFEVVPMRMSADNLSNEVRLNKLCLLWNTEVKEGGDDDGDQQSLTKNSTPNSIRHDPNDGHALCSCDYMEVKLYDLVQCSVSIQSSTSAVSNAHNKPDDNNNNNSNNNALPKLLVTLIRRTCSKCS